ncbi:S-adenosyl-L-methionine-dependent methyltransferase [Trichophaea hybrida]|nr:S-adenosyl-L-methionine-dependent methyltransferase [Trichophaea hybrida]
MGLSQLPSTLWNILHTRPKDLFFYSRWADDYFRHVWALFTESERLEEKRRLAAGCQGIVIEVGPGFGPSIEHFNKENVKHVYAVEPNLALHEGLRENIAKFGWEGRCTIVSCGIEDDEGLKKAGVPQEGVDSVISIQVLCTVPTLHKVLPALHRRLKSGGELRIFEHTQSHDKTTMRLQRLYDWIWHFPFGGCELSRPTDRLLVDAEYMGFKDGEGWKEIDLNKIKGESRYSCFPSSWGTLVKA